MERRLKEASVGGSRVCREEGTFDKMKARYKLTTVRFIMPSVELKYPRIVYASVKYLPGRVAQDGGKYLKYKAHAGHRPAAVAAESRLCIMYPLYH